MYYRQVTIASQVPRFKTALTDEEEVSWDLLYRKVCAFTLEARFEKTFLMTPQQVYSA
jgi:hypothetical protein